MTERFIVSSVTGWVISQAAESNHKPSTVYQVLDRAYCYALVLETTSRPAVERIAAALNAGDGRPLEKFKRMRASHQKLYAPHRKNKVAA